MAIEAIIQEIIRQKDAKILSGQEAMQRILAEVQKQVLGELGNASISGWNEYRLKQLLDAVERKLADYGGAAGGELKDQIKKMWDLGQQSVYKPLNEAGIYTGFDLSSSTLEVLSDFGYHKIQKVKDAAFDKIKTELTMGILGGKTPQQVADAIGTNLTSPGVFSSIAARAETITKTEMGRVFSEAAERRRQQAAASVDGLMKIWDHAGHPMHARTSHLAVHGQKVPVDEPFKLVDVDGYQLMYPHDPNADISEVINCGCDAVTWMDSWGDPPKKFRN